MAHLSVNLSKQLNLKKKMLVYFLHLLQGFLQVLHLLKVVLQALHQALQVLPQVHPVLHQVLHLQEI